MTASSIPPDSRPAADASAALGLPRRWVLPSAVLVAVLIALCGVALALAWAAHQRVRTLEQTLVKRQIDSAALAAQAQLVSQHAQDSARDSAAKGALMEERVAGLVSQRLQLDELIASLSRSREDTLLVDVESALRMAMLQAEITASLTPLVITLKQIDERLARQNDPLLERVRRAVALDLERVRNASTVDVAALVNRVDEAARGIDDLPLLAEPERRAAVRGTAARAATKASAAARTASAASPVAEAADADASAKALSGGGWAGFGGYVWAEVRQLVRVTRIDQPEAMLVAPEQAYFLRENLKLRLLNARLALLGRQFDTAQVDLRDAQQSLERYFDRSARRVVTTLESLRHIAARAHQVPVPRPEATLSALAAAAAGR
ncbi:MAG: uroporphyrinogen-III C-methyltransferase [Rubrivivax sp.]